MLSYWRRIWKGKRECSHSRGTGNQKRFSFHSTLLCTRYLHTAKAVAVTASYGDGLVEEGKRLLSGT